VQKASPGLGEFEFEKRFCARALPRALSALQSWQKLIFSLFFAIFSSNAGNICARSLRGSARAPEISSDSNSVEKIDDFCTKNEFKISKTRF